MKVIEAPTCQHLQHGDVNKAARERSCKAVHVWPLLTPLDKEGPVEVGKPAVSPPLHRGGQNNPYCKPW